MSNATIKDRSAQLDHYLQNQMRKTGNQVRLVDLFTSCMTLFAGLLGGLFLLALMDAWIIELAPWARWTCLVALLGGAATYAVLAIVPLLIRKINPVYAAQVVESAQPNMKNSLINYLLLRKQDGNVSRRVVHIVGSQAASSISGVPVENTVDKSHTIRVAMILTCVVIALAAYKVFSPKDPFQTFARILAPASDLTKPARVQISQVKPGNTEVFFGTRLVVTAKITGQFDVGQARVVFTTRDGQIVNGSIRLEKVQSSPNQFRCELQTSDRGIEHSLMYQVVAGDGKSAEYAVDLKSTPILTVESIHYKPPAYMELGEHTQTGTSTIEGYEGTQVTLDAIGNADIRTAYIQLLKKDSRGEFDPAGSVPMERVDDRHARGQFLLTRDRILDQSRFTHYQLVLVTADGGRSNAETVNPIRVKPDLAPGVEIVDPTQQDLKVPANSRIRFRVRADDDFKLARLDVVAEHNGRGRVLREGLSLRGQDLSIGVNVDYEFWPKKSLLKAGDTVYLQFHASDNRHSYSRNEEMVLDPNSTTTPVVKIEVVHSIQDPPAEKDDQEQDQQNQEEPPSDKEDKPEQNQESEDKGESGDSSETEQSDQQNGSGEQDDQSRQEQSGDQQGNEEKSEGQDGDTGDPGSSGSDETSGDESQESSDEGDEGSGDQQDGQGSESAGDSQQSSDGKQNGESGSGDDGQPGDQKSSDSDKSGQQPGTNSQQGEGQRSSDASQQNSNDESSSGQPGDQSSDTSDRGPVSEDAHDGQIFEEIMNHRQQQQESQQQDGQDGQQDGQQATNQDDATGQGQSQGSSEKGDPQQNQAGTENPGQDSDSQQSNSGEQQATGDQQQAGGENSQSGDSQEKEGAQDSGSQEKQQTGSSPRTDENGMDRQSQKSDPNANNSGSAPEEAGNAGESQQDQDGGAGDQSEKQSSQSAGQSSQQEKSREDQQQDQGGGGSDQEEQQQKGAGGGQDQEEQKGGGNQSDQSAGGKSGDSGESGTGGQQPGENGSQSGGESGGQKGSGDSDKKGGNPEQDQQSQSGDSSSDSGSGQKSDQESSRSDGQQGGSPEQGLSSEKGSQKGSQEGAQSGDQQGTPGEKGGGEQSQSGGSAGNQSEGQVNNTAGGGNQPGSGASSSTASGSGNQSTPDGNGTAADKANLEFTKKATDMAIEYLEDQQIDPDPKLLERLNWSEEDLRDFVQRWKKLKKDALSGDEQSREKLEKALNSLGLGDADSAKHRFEGLSDDQSGYQEDGRVDNLPAGFAERFNAYSRKRSRAKRDR